MQHDQSQYLPAYWFAPVLQPWEQLQARSCEHFLLFNCLKALNTHLFSIKAHEDTICEIAGGEARTTRVLIRLHDHRISTGPNFDLVADIDLTNNEEQWTFWQYRNKRKPKAADVDTPNKEELPMRRGGRGSEGTTAEALVGSKRRATSPAV